MIGEKPITVFPSLSFSPSLQPCVPEVGYYSATGQIGLSASSCPLLRIPPTPLSASVPNRYPPVVTGQEPSGTAVPFAASAGDSPGITELAASSSISFKLQTERKGIHLGNSNHSLAYSPR